MKFIINDLDLCLAICYVSFKREINYKKNISVKNILNVNKKKIEVIE